MRTGFGRGGRASFVSISSATMFAMRTTRSSTAHSSYFAGRTLTALGADLVRFGANSWLLLLVDWVSSAGCLLFTPGDSGCKIGLDGEGGIVDRGAGVITVGLGATAGGGG